jgi:hypothetical protein
MVAQTVAERPAAINNDRELGSRAVGKQRTECNVTFIADVLVRTPIGPVLSAEVWLKHFWMVTKNK